MFKIFSLDKVIIKIIDVFYLSFTLNSYHLSIAVIFTINVCGRY
jgi:hypothetical protein